MVKYLVVLVVENPLASAGDTGDVDLIPRWGRSPGGEHGNHSNILSRESYGQRNLVGYTSQGLKQLDSTEHICTHLITEVQII